MKKYIYLLILTFISFNFSNSYAGQKDKIDLIKTLEDSLKIAPNNSRLLLNLGILYHNAGSAGDEDAVERGEELLEKLVELEPENPDVHCWYGSVLTLVGRDAWLPFNKTRYVNKGTKEMDVAVKLAPDNVNIRMVRANNSLALPSFFNRIDTAIVDFEHLITMAEKNQKMFDNDFQSRIHLKLGYAYKKKGKLDKARESWKKSTELSPESDSGMKAKKLLADTKG